MYYESFVSLSCLKKEIVFNQHKKLKDNGKRSE